MPKNWQRSLGRWVEARLIDAGTAERIQAFENDRERRGGRRWPVILACVFGGLLLCAGVLLFVAAHWDEMSPRSEEHTSELQSRPHLVCRLLLEKKKKKTMRHLLFRRRERECKIIPHH